MEIINISIYVIDYNKNKIELRDLPDTFDNYLGELVNHIRNNNTVRDFKTRTKTTEVIGLIKHTCANQDDNESVLKNMYKIAWRLLLKERDAQEKIVHTETEIQKGSLVQALIYDNDRYFYLLAKVQHKEWIDDADFKFKTGFSKDKKTIWKSCLFDLEDIEANEIYAKIYSDTKAKYWSSDFLELDEVTSDETNTEKAFKSIDSTLGRMFKEKTSYSDHTIIRNSFICYFKTHEYIDYTSMVKEILDDYQPKDEKISNSLKDLKKKLLELPDKKHFDNQFSPVAKIINARIRKIYPIRTGIDLRINSGIDNLKDVIKSTEIEGARYIFIRTDNDDTYNKFKY